MVEERMLIWEITSGGKKLVVRTGDPETGELRDVSEHTFTRPQGKEDMLKFVRLNYPLSRNRVGGIPS
jgi:hypothetical protein